jgi:hypothetical protein
LNPGANTAVEQIVAREPRLRVSQDAFLIQRGRYRAAASTQPFGGSLANDMFCLMVARLVFERVAEIKGSTCARRTVAGIERCVV